MSADLEPMSLLDTFFPIDLVFSISYDIELFSTI